VKGKTVLWRWHDMSLRKDRVTAVTERAVCFSNTWWHTFDEVTLVEVLNGCHEACLPSWRPRSSAATSGTWATPTGVTARSRLSRPASASVSTNPTCTTRSSTSGATRSTCGMTEGSRHEARRGAKRRDDGRPGIGGPDPA